MGEVQVPADALWGAQTARAVENFPISGQPVPPGVVHALARLKAAAAEVNAELGVLDADRARAIAAAAGEVADGEHDDEFPIDVFQTGSGTSTNMNVNEVVARLAHLASDLDVHPNDHVNAGQSSNDTFPSALRIAATSAAVLDLVPALEHLALALGRKEAEFADVVKAGRTHLMDAVPVTLGQEFGGYRRQVELGASRVRTAAEATSELPLGGTAAGTGLNAAPGFARQVIERVSGVTGLPFREAANHFEAQSAQDAVVELSGALKVVAVSLTKICNDLRWMSSGPRTGPRRDPPARPAARVEHHARQGQPGRARGDAHGLRAGHRQRRRHHDGGRRGQLRAQRHAAGHGQERPRVDRAARRDEPAARRPVHRRHHGRGRARAGPRRGVAVDRHAAQPLHRLRGRRGGRQAGRQGAPDDP